MHEANGNNGKIKQDPRGHAPGSKKHWFQRGGGSGRKLGSTNKITRVLRDAILEAAEAVGSDGKGKEKLVGYLKSVAVSEPKAFTSLLSKLIPYQMNVDKISTTTTYRSYAEVSLELGHHGLSLETIAKLQQIDLTPDPDERPFSNSVANGDAAKPNDEEN
jgi:hypothetical protein